MPISMEHSSTGKPEIPPGAITLSIANEFSKTPGGRYRHEGPFSGQQFREELLLPRFEDALKAKVKLYVDLDGGYGYPSSFLEEAFGGLVREKKSVAVVRDNIVFSSIEEPYRLNDVRRYINEALDK